VREVNDNKPMSRQAVAFARGMKNALEPLRSIHPTITLQLAYTYLQVVFEEGLTVSALAARCGVSHAVMSRHLRDLGNVNRHKKTGLELVAACLRRPSRAARDPYPKGRRRGPADDRGGPTGGADTGITQAPTENG
jgi:hypothetical protein